LCCARNNRGVAQGQGRLYLARLDATLVALSQSTGQQLWKATVDNWQNGYTMTIPPQYVNGMVIVGVSGGEYFIRGHVDAYNAKTGSLVWRFYTTDPNTFAGATLSDLPRAASPRQINYKKSRPLRGRH
jgi:alcohol dehydrogenase (cytochrome c)